MALHCRRRQGDLRTQAASGPSECVIVGLGPAWSPFFLTSEECWWARQTVEFTDTVQPTSSLPSAADRTATRIRSQVPSTAYLMSRLWAVWNGPSSSGRSRQGEQVRYFSAMASRVRRWSAHLRPRTGSVGISGSIRSHIASVITNRTDASDQLTSRSKRHALIPRPPSCFREVPRRRPSSAPDPQPAGAASIATFRSRRPARHSDPLRDVLANYFSDLPRKPGREQ